MGLIKNSTSKMNVDEIKLKIAIELRKIGISSKFTDNEVCMCYRKDDGTETYYVMPSGYLRLVVLHSYKEDQAKRTAFKLLYDRIASSVSQILIGVATIEEIFLPYLYMGDVKLLTDSLNNKKSWLPNTIHQQVYFNTLPEKLIPEKLTINSHLLTAPD